MVQTRQILIVDDDAELREALAEQLAMHEEFEVVAADTAAAARAAMQTNPPHLVVMDVGLPDMDGREAVNVHSPLPTTSCENVGLRLFCIAGRCSTVVRAPGEKARPDGLLDAGPRYWRCTPSRSQHPGRGFVPRVVLSLSEPQRRDQDVALPHVANQIPIGADRPSAGSTATAGIDQPSS